MIKRSNSLRLYAIFTMTMWKLRMVHSAAAAFITATTPNRLKISLFNPIYRRRENMRISSFRNEYNQQRNPYIISEPSTTMPSITTSSKSQKQTVGSRHLFRNQLHYEYVSTYDSSTVTESKKAKVIILFVVGTAMSVDVYTDMARKCVTGQSTVFVTVDNNPGALVKLSGDQTAMAFNDLAAKATERLGDIVASDAKIFIGGHSAGGFSAIAAMKVNGGNLNFEPAGYIGADPLGFPLMESPQVSSLKINCPTFAMGFTVETNAVKPKEAGLAAYNVSSDGNRILMQIDNLKDRGNQITHCIFASDVCGIIHPNHGAGAWVRHVVGDFAILFVDSVVKGKTVAKSMYESATGDKSDLVNVFYGYETATV